MAIPVFLGIGEVAVLDRQDGRRACNAPSLTRTGFDRLLDTSVDRLSETIDRGDNIAPVEQGILPDLGRVKSSLVGTQGLEKPLLSPELSSMPAQLTGTGYIGSATGQPGFTVFTEELLSNALPEPALQPLGNNSINREPLTGNAISTMVPLSEKPPGVTAEKNHLKNRFAGLIRRASARFGVDEALVKAVIRAESDFDATTVSTVGAAGLMQLMPETAADLGVRDRFNPEENVMAGTRYLRGFLEKYQGDLDRVLAAYNWGPGNVDRKGIDVLPLETTNYLARVKQYYSEYKA